MTGAVQLVHPQAFVRSQTLFALWASTRYT